VTYETVSPADIPGSPLANALKQPLMLGVFLNLQDIRLSTLPTSSTWTFDYNAEVVRKADDLASNLRSAVRNGCQKAAMTAKPRSMHSSPSAPWPRSPRTSC
jgi:hypothetical protein